MFEGFELFWREVVCQRHIFHADGSGFLGSDDQHRPPLGEYACDPVVVGQKGQVDAVCADRDRLEAMRTEQVAQEVGF